MNIRNCPLCGKEIHYVSKYAVNGATKKNTKCSKCNADKIRGKTYEQIYGKEKALELKANRKKTYEEFYGKERAKEIRKKISNANKGRTLKEIHGIEKAKEISKKISVAGKGRIPWNKGLTKHDDNRIGNNNLKGRTWEEIYGVKKATELVKIRSRSYIEMYGEVEAIRRISVLSESHKGKKSTAESNRKRRLSNIKRIEKNIVNGGQIIPFYNPKGCQLFEEIMKSSESYIQHAENGGEYHIKELGYWVDGYDAENNIVYEYDEKQHFDIHGNLKKRDICRQDEITKLKEQEQHELPFQFIRIKDEKIK